MLEKARCWLLSRHWLAMREEEERLEEGRLSMISSMISWGSESMVSWQSVRRQSGSDGGERL